jgi:uncharacterized protein YkwD
VSGARYLQDRVRLNFRGYSHAGCHGGVGETLQYNAIASREAITSLPGSPEHCPNLMDPASSRFGTVVVSGRLDTLFGTPWVRECGTAR